MSRWYIDEGYVVLDRNWYGDAGELDLVVGRDGQIVFCEVKTRASTRFGVPAEAVDRRKQHRIRGLAVEWLRTRGLSGDIRFDVASVLGGRVTVIEGAF